MFLSAQWLLATVRRLCDGDGCDRVKSIDYCEGRVLLNREKEECVKCTQRGGSRAKRAKTQVGERLLCSLRQAQGTMQDPSYIDFDICTTSLPPLFWSRATLRSHAPASNEGTANLLRLTRRIVVTLHVSQNSWVCSGAPTKHRTKLYSNQDFDTRLQASGGPDATINLSP